MNQYLIAYNNTQGFDQNKIHQVIVGTPTVTDWWHYLPNLYIVSTTNSAKYLADRIISNFQGLLFLVIKLDTLDYNGVLNKDAWDWIKKNNNQKLKFRVVPKSSANTLPTIPPFLSGMLPTTLNPKPKTLEDILRKKW